MKRLNLRTVYVACLLVLAACGNSSDVPAPDEPDTGLLRKANTASELESSLKSGLTTIRDTQEVGLAIADATAAASPDNFTGTYTQEENVDEFDAVRYDGEHLYVAPRRYFGCCYILAAAANDGASSTGTTPERSIRILATDPDDGSASLAGEIPLADNLSVQGMYLSDKRMFALTGQSIYGSHGRFWSDIAIWAPERLGYQVYDVSDPGAPVLEADVKIDGIFIESRRIGDTVYIVSRYAPWIDGLNYYVTTSEEQAHNEAILAGVTLDDMLPKITVNDVTTSLVAPDKCYITNTDDVAGYAVITSITAVSISDPTSFTTTCYNEETYGVYVSENALYVTQTRPQTSVSRYDTRIHKFALASTDVRYRGSIDIEGQVWRGGQADFRMSEHQGDLRVLASLFDWNNEDFVDHKLYVLRESTTSPELTVVSELPNETRPEEIGKPNEALYGVRFLADRAYAVTFERIDPLYAIDLTDPADPYIAGELFVTGFSDFLHPVTDELLLGLGTGGNGGIKLELFDVSNIAQPLSRGSATLGGRGSWSEATYDRHAFTYQSDVNGIDRFTIPAQLYSADGSFSFFESGLFLFEIRDKNMPAVAALNSVGSIIPDVGGFEIPFISSRNRAFIHNDTVYYVRDEAVWSAFWHTPSIVNGPY
ncbi:MAG: hypothetical protein GY783_19170 [Gammaproteobacteria bacterium]|nr:hypothetical protein [Gammaproteobacteria bacterium]